MRSTGAGDGSQASQFPPRVLASMSEEANKSLMAFPGITGAQYSITQLLNENEVCLSQVSPVLHWPASLVFLTCWGPESLWGRDLPSPLLSPHLMEGMQQSSREGAPQTWGVFTTLQQLPGKGSVGPRPFTKTIHIPPPQAWGISFLPRAIYRFTASLAGQTQLPT